MSLTTKNPLRMGGANFHSGTPNTGEVMQTFGGGMTVAIYSGTAVLSGALTAAYTSVGAAAGTGYDLVLFSGAGRLKDIQPHVQGSGVAVTFYDAGAVASGGPFPSSGTKVLATLPANTWTGGAGGVFGIGPQIYSFDVPFTSGLCVALKSGQPGMTITFTPEVNQTNPAV